MLFVDTRFNRFPRVRRCPSAATEEILPAVVCRETRLSLHNLYEPEKTVWVWEEVWQRERATARLNLARETLQSNHQHCSCHCHSRFRCVLLGVKNQYCENNAVLQNGRRTDVRTGALQIFCGSWKAGNKRYQRLDLKGQNSRRRHPDWWRRLSSAVSSSRTRVYKRRFGRLGEHHWYWQQNYYVRCNVGVGQKDNWWSDIDFLV